MSEEKKTDLWWFGFDCAHCDDLRPEHAEEGYYATGKTYRTFEYAEAETEGLAVQLSEIRVSPCPCCAREY
jgi:hypothetical protein